SIIEGNHVIGPVVTDGGRYVLQFDPVPTAAVPHPALAPGGLDEDAAHGLGGRREEVGAAVPVVGLTAADEPEVRLVDQGRGLQCLTGPLPGELVGSQPPQLAVE